MKRFAAVFVVALGSVTFSLYGQTNVSVATPLIQEGRLLTLTLPPPAPKVPSTNTLTNALLAREGRMMTLDRRSGWAAGYKMKTKTVVLTPEEAQRIKLRQELREKLKALDPVVSP